MAKFDVPIAVTHEALGRALQALAVPGVTIRTKGKRWRFGRKGERLTVKAKPRKGGTRIKVSPDYPFWIYFFLPLGLLAVFIGMLVYDSTVKELLNHVKARLPLALQGGVAAPAGLPAVACPYCESMVQPLVNAQGQRLCPVCRNTGKAVAIARLA